MAVSKPTGGRWVTIRGAHVFVGKSGRIEKGPAGLVGATPGEAAGGGKVLPSTNEAHGRGFSGTMAQALSTPENQNDESTLTTSRKHHEAASDGLREGLGSGASPRRVQTFLDSSAGRHFADALVEKLGGAAAAATADRSAVRDAAKQLAKERGWQRSFSEHLRGSLGPRSKNVLAYRPLDAYRRSVPLVEQVKAGRAARAASFFKGNMSPANTRSMQATHREQVKKANKVADAMQKEIDWDRRNPFTPLSRNPFGKKKSR